MNNSRLENLMKNSRLETLVNRDNIAIEGDLVPVLATPAAFAAGVVAGAKASALLVCAAGVGVMAADARNK